MSTFLDMDEIELDYEGLDYQESPESSNYSSSEEEEEVDPTNFECVDEVADENQKAEQLKELEEKFTTNWPNGNHSSQGLRSQSPREDSAGLKSGKRRFGRTPSPWTAERKSLYVKKGEFDKKASSRDDRPSKIRKAKSPSPSLLYEGLEKRRNSASHISQTNEKQRDFDSKRVTSSSQDFARMTSTGNKQKPNRVYRIEATKVHEEGKQFFPDVPKKKTKTFISPPTNVCSSIGRDGFPGSSTSTIGQLDREKLRFENGQSAQPLRRVPPPPPPPRRPNGMESQHRALPMIPNVLPPRRPIPPPPPMRAQAEASRAEVQLKVPPPPLRRPTKGESVNSDETRFFPTPPRPTAIKRSPTENLLRHNEKERDQPRFFPNVPPQSSLPIRRRSGDELRHIDRRRSHETHESIQREPVKVRRVGSPTRYPSALQRSPRTMERTPSRDSSMSSSRSPRFTNRKILSPSPQFIQKIHQKTPPIEENKPKKVTLVSSPKNGQKIAQVVEICADRGLLVSRNKEEKNKKLVAIAREAQKRVKRNEIAERVTEVTPPFTPDLSRRSTPTYEEANEPSHLLLGEIIQNQTNIHFKKLALQSIAEFSNEKLMTALPLEEKDIQLEKPSKKLNQLALNENDTQLSELNESKNQLSSALILETKNIQLKEEKLNPLILNDKNIEPKELDDTLSSSLVENHIQLNEINSKLPLNDKNTQQKDPPDRKSIKPKNSKTVAQIHFSKASKISGIIEPTKEEIIGGSPQKLDLININNMNSNADSRTKIIIDNKVEEKKIHPSPPPITEPIVMTKKPRIPITGPPLDPQPSILKSNTKTEFFPNKKWPLPKGQNYRLQQQESLQKGYKQNRFIQMQPSTSRHTVIEIPPKRKTIVLASEQRHRFPSVQREFIEYIEEIESPIYSPQPRQVFFDVPATTSYRSMAPLTRTIRRPPQTRLQNDEDVLIVHY